MNKKLLRKIGSPIMAVMMAMGFYMISQKVPFFAEYAGEKAIAISAIMGVMFYALCRGVRMPCDAEADMKRIKKWEKRGWIEQEPVMSSCVKENPVAKKSTPNNTVQQKPAAPKTNVSDNTVKREAPKQKAPTAPEKTAISHSSQKNTVTLDSIAGYTATKQSMAFLVECLRNSQKLQQMGAEIPTGVLLYGPPGTGKTLFAKAVAGSAGVPFYCVSAAGFMEKFVGVGAQRVRELFESARKHQPCIVFIDEIDAIGKNRDSNTNDERQQTLNQMLTEMSAISADHESILVMAATNRLDDLDSALIRPGRFDRKIAVPLPNRDDRMAIIKMHCKKKRMAEDVNLNELAMLTEGMSGADLASLINEAAIQAVYQNHSAIMQDDLDNAVFRVLTDGEKMEVKDPEALKVIAYHESGHALITKLFTHDSIPQISVIGSTSGSLGLTMRCSEQDNQMLSKKQLEAKIMTYYGGRAAEECYFGNNGDITTGASDDLKEASRLIREYLTTYGMSSDCILNMEAFNGAPDPNLTHEAKNLANTLYQNTLTALKEHRAELDHLAAELLKKKTLTGDEINRILN